MTPVSFIQEFGKFLQEINISAKQNAEKLHSSYGWTEKDIRVAFFNTISETAFTHGLTIYLIDTEILKNKNNWRESQEYFLPTRNDVFERLLKTYPFQIRDNFFFDFIMHLEDILRIFAEKIIFFINDSISVVKDQLIKIFALDLEYKNLLDVLFKFRNTIHNGGLHSETKPSKTFKGNVFNFTAKKFSQSGLDNLDYLFKEVFNFMNELFNHSLSTDVSFVGHPYEFFVQPSS